jgi:hypothetical protein
LVNHVAKFKDSYQLFFGALFVKVDGIETIQVKWLSSMDFPISKVWKSFKVEVDQLELVEAELQFEAIECLDFTLIFSLILGLSKLKK